MHENNLENIGSLQIHQREPSKCCLCGAEQAPIPGDTFHMHSGKTYCRECHLLLYRTHTEIEQLKSLETKKIVRKQDYIQKRLGAIE